MRTRAQLVTAILEMRQPAQAKPTVSLEPKQWVAKKVVFVTPAYVPPANGYRPPVWHVRPGADAHLKIKRRGMG